MSIRIEPTERNTFLINGKEVFKNMDGNWIAKDIKMFTAQELRAWSNYKKVAIDGNRKNLTITISR